MKKAVLELQAIEAVRKELEQAIQSEKPGIEIAEIHSRLMSLYASLDIANVVDEIVTHYGKAA